MHEKKINRTLTIEDRKELEKLLHQQITKKEIARKLGINYTTVFREINRCREAYNAEEAHNTVGKSTNLLDFEIIGKRFGLVVVKSFANIYKNRSWWNCICDCGKQCIISRKVLAEYCSKKRPLSCGCIPKQWGGRNHALPKEELALRKYLDLLKFRQIDRECWNWTGYKQKGKTPKTSWKNKGMTVRKCMYMLMNGVEYEPNPVFTTCGNLLCFNPEHLTLERPNKRHYYE